MACKPFRIAWLHGMNAVISLKYPGRDTPDIR